MRLNLFPEADLDERIAVWPPAPHLKWTVRRSGNCRWREIESQRSKAARQKLSPDDRRAYVAAQQRASKLQGRLHEIRAEHDGEEISSVDDIPALREVVYEMSEISMELDSFDVAIKYSGGDVATALVAQVEGVLSARDDETGEPVSVEEWTPEVIAELLDQYKELRLWLIGQAYEQEAVYQEHLETCLGNSEASSATASAEDEETPSSSAKSTTESGPAGSSPAGGELPS